MLEGALVAFWQLLITWPIGTRQAARRTVVKGCGLRQGDDRGNGLALAVMQLLVPSSAISASADYARAVLPPNGSRLIIDSNRERLAVQINLLLLSRNLGK